MNLLFIIATLLAFAASLLLTPLVKRLARRLGIVEHPDNFRKLHATPTPLCGGLAVLGGFTVAVLLLPLLWSDSQSELLWQPASVVSLLVAMYLITLLGLIDDRFELRGRQKLLGQFLAALILMAAGLVIKRVALFGYTIELGPLAFPFTAFWLLGAINSLNLLDGMDGLATSVGLILSIAIAGMALLTDHYADAMLAAAMAGALAGFLLYNFPPASIFLGDAGSMLIGLVLGALAIRCSLKGPATIALAAPAAIWAIPIMDVGMAIIRRKLTGRSIYTTDRGHLHHTLLRRGFSTARTVLLIALLCTVTAVAAVVSVYMRHEELAIGAIAAVVAALAVGRLFGHQEFFLVLLRAKHFGLSLVPFLRRRNEYARQMTTRLQGTRQWEELWSTLIGYAERFDLHTIQLNVHLPAVGEDFHANWKRHAAVNDSRRWCSEIPLLASGIVIGQLKLSGNCSNGSSCHWVADLIAGLKPFEDSMAALIEETAGLPNASGTLLHAASVPALATVPVAVDPAPVEE
jgi:UDP-GlcNAc:undecaprenyl-phosphate GlcNAc-1-phosphate transferase